MKEDIKRRFVMAERARTIGAMLSCNDMVNALGLLEDLWVELEDHCRRGEERSVRPPRAVRGEPNHVYLASDVNLAKHVISAAFEPSAALQPAMDYFRTRRIHGTAALVRCTVGDAAHPQRVPLRAEGGVSSKGNQ